MLTEKATSEERKSLSLCYKNIEGCGFLSGPIRVDRLDYFIKKCKFIQKMSDFYGILLEVIKMYSSDLFLSKLQ